MPPGEDLVGDAFQRPPDSLLAAAQLWWADTDGTPHLVVGWEDAFPFCAAVCTTDVGLSFCGRCPTRTVQTALATGRPKRERCPAGVQLLALPAPRRSRRTAVVLRLAGPPPRRAARIAERVRVEPRALRQAAAVSPTAQASAVAAAARTLRRVDGLLAWVAAHRREAADRRRAATAALAQVFATSEELLDLWRAAQRQRRALARQQRQLERLAREAIQAQDRERSSIAHEIHDTAAQSLVSAFRFLDAARSDVGRPEVAAAHLEEAGRRLAAAMSELRSILHRLVPPGVAELGLRRALAARLDELTRGTAISGQVLGELPPLPEWVEAALYGMAAEAMSNAVRHGDPRTITVELAVRRRRAVVVVRDDGRGFHPSAVGGPGGAGLGLQGLARRARWLGGTASVTSHPGQGTRVEIRVPLVDDAGAPPSGGPPERPSPS
jgi:signal transduction histidine kinase